MTVKKNGDSIFTLIDEDGQATVVEINTPEPEVWRDMTVEQKNVVLRQQLEEYDDQVVDKIYYTLCEMKVKNIFPMGERRVDGREVHKPEFIPENLS